MKPTLLCYDYSDTNISPLSAFTKQAQLIFCDPPYNIGVNYADDETRDRLSLSSYKAFCRHTVSQLSACLTDNGTFWWMCPPQHGDFIGPLLTELIGPRVYQIVWRESFAQYQQRRLTQDYRFIFCHSRDPKRIVFNPDAIREQSVRQQMGDKRADPRGRVPGQVWDIRRLQGTAKDRVDWHPAQLAPELFRRLVLGFTNEDQLVIDGFAGSGTMGVVCREYKRRCVLIERSAQYIERMRERLKYSLANRNRF